jgi:hypothetical protein
MFFSEVGFVGFFLLAFVLIQKQQKIKTAQYLPKMLIASLNKKNSLHIVSFKQLFVFNATR